MSGRVRCARVPVPPDCHEIAALGRAGGRLGIDTEFMGEGRYRTLLCLVQTRCPTAPAGCAST